ncbi:hypothetical protein QQF64_002048 [Cirrhinus molitorella]|uniref:Uncharacterized protein n=1 Tax=Cirrhinus molitorella TaxID=172907 RepID=A0ABR3MP22_9TELE
MISAIRFPTIQFNLLYPRKGFLRLTNGVSSFYKRFLLSSAWSRPSPDTDRVLCSMQMERWRTDGRIERESEMEDRWKRRP